jgi:LysR family transcriptional regulator, regulator for metE and metH
MPMIDRSHLRILREIDAQGSLTAAATALHLTQSALSHKIIRLEQQIGTPVWRKEGRNLKLTQAGNYLLREAKRLLPQLERIDEVLEQYVKGEKGALSIGMECHPCYQWLLLVINPFLQQWPEVDVDVTQKFQFGGLAALFNYEIDLLVTPDPVLKEGIVFEPVFPYEQVLVVGKNHPFAGLDWVNPEQIIDQTLYTYPVAVERLDIYQQFLLPANCLPKNHKDLEATELMLQMVAANRGVASLPLWLVKEYQKSFAVASVRLGEQGIHKHIHVGIRSSDSEDIHLKAFITSVKSLPIL